MIVDKQAGATNKNSHKHTQTATAKTEFSIVAPTTESESISDVADSGAVTVELLQGQEKLVLNGKKNAPTSKAAFFKLGFKLGKNANLPSNNAAFDVIAIIASFFTIHFLYLGNLDLSSSRSLVFISALVFISIGLFFGGAYTPKRNQSYGREIAVLLLCWAIAFASVGLFSFLSKTAGDVSRVWITLSFAASFLVFVIQRASSRLQILNRSVSHNRNIIICGYDSNIETAVFNLRNDSTADFTISGIFRFDEGKVDNNLQLLSQPIVNFVEEKRAAGIPIEQVWVALPSSHSGLIQQLARSLHNSSVDICVVPDSYTESLMSGDSIAVGNTNIVNISEISLTPTAVQFKRVFDVLVASFALMLLFVPMAIIAVIIKLDSKGSALFRQKRYGVDGKEIEVYKFRSMKLHSDNQVVQATRNDSRVTAVGSFLRKSSLDELPQLINVLQGHMSLVGPRPHAVVHNEMWRTQIHGYMLRHKVRPGITGLAQVSGWRGETDTEYKMRQRVRYDLKYIKEWSPYLDIKILFLTVFNGLSGENAY